MSPVITVAEVLRRLEALDEALPPSDGVKWFNKLYLEVTRHVAASVPSEPQAAPGFLEALDAFFGNRYFDALDAAGGEASCRRAMPSMPGSRSSRPASRGT